MNELVIRAVAVLLWSRAVRPMPAAKAAKRLLSALASQQPQVGPERAQDAALDHVQAPQQQRHAAHQVEKNHGFPCSFAFPAIRVRKVRLPPNRSADQPLNLLKIARAEAAGMGSIRLVPLPSPVNGDRT